MERKITSFLYLIFAKGEVKAQMLYASCNRKLALRGERMNTKGLAVCLLILMATMSMICIPAVFAQNETHWITKYKVQDALTGATLIEADFENYEEPLLYQSILSGQQLKVTFTVNVPVTLSAQLRLFSMMQRPAGGQYWDLISTDYDMGDSYTPNSATLTFPWNAGTFEMICYGNASRVAKATNVTLVQLSAVGGDILDAIKALVLTSGGGNFESLYLQKEAKLESLIAAGVVAGYTQMYEEMLNQSRALLNKGYESEAIALLNAIPSSGEPLGSAQEIILFPVIGVAAAAAVIFAFMFLRARGKNSYTRLVIEDQIKDLEGLTLRATKIDRTMASSLDSVKDRLKRLVGM